MLTILGFVLPVVAYFWLIHEYAVNILWLDQWGDVYVIFQTHSHTLDLSALWAQHTENRIFFPNLIVVLLAHTTHFNVVTEEYLSAIMLTVATGLFVLAHRRRSLSVPWIYYCPVVIVMLAFVQNSDTLWGFQMAWYLVMMSLAVALFLLDRPTITWIALIGALVAGVVGSYSSMEGLLIWPTGLALLYLRTRPKTMLLTWFAIAVVTTIVYFHRFNFALDGSKSSYALHHPTAALEFFFFAIGNVLGVQAGTGIDVGYLMGFMLSLVALYVVVAYGVRRSDANGSPLGVALVWFGLLFAGLITLGRSSYGLALGSRYAPFDDLILVGCYLALFEKPTFRLRTRTPDRSASIVYLDGPVTRLLGLPTRHDPGRRWDQTFLFASRGVLVLAIGLLAVVGTANGLAKANRWRGTELQAADVTVNIKDASDSLVSKAVASGASEEVSSIKELTPFARSERLSLFNTPLVARDTLRGSYSVIQRPLDGTILSGTVVLAATTGASSNLTVRFFASGGALHQASIATGLHTTVGWVAYWNTKSVANGKYELRSSLQYAGRQEPLGLPVSVIIRN